MPKLYIANTTKQNHIFMYLMPEIAGRREQLISMGNCVQIAGEMSTDTMDYIIKQHERYGLLCISELDRTKGYVGLCWDTKPISVDKIKKGLEHNDAALEKWGVQLRKQAALMADRETRAEDPSLKALDITITEIPAKDGGAPSMGEQRIRVDRDPGSDAPKPSGRGRSKRAA